MNWTSAAVFAKRRQKIYSVNRQNNTLFLVMMALMFAGVAFGTVLASSGYLGDESKELILQAADEMTANSSGTEFVAAAAVAFLPSLAMMSVIFLSGFCAATAPLAMLMPFAKGIGFGVVCACIYLRDGAVVFGRIALCIFPMAFLSGILIALAAMLSVKFSAKYFKGLLCGSEEFPHKTEITQYCIKNLALLAAVSAASTAGAAIAQVYLK